MVAGTLAVCRMSHVISWEFWRVRIVSVSMGIGVWMLMCYGPIMTV